MESYIALDGSTNKKAVNIDDFVYENKYSFVSLSPKEQEYLKEKKIIKFCIDPDWMPFEKIDEKGNHMGLSSDYFEIFKQKISIPLMLIKTNSWSESLEFVKTRRCDMLALAARISSRDSYLNFTQPYINVPLVLATKPNISFIDDMLRINNVKVGVTKGYIFKELLEKKYTNFDIIEVENSSDGLHKVVKGELFGYIDTLATIAYKLQNGLMGELKIAAKLDEKLKLSIALRKDEPLLLTVFEKMLATIDNNKRQEIFNKYVAIVYEKKANYSLWIKSMLLALFIIVLIVYWNRRLHKEKANTEKALEELKYVERILEQKNKELEQISITDKLTGVYNRTKTDRTLQEELDRSTRTREPFSIIMLDIDLFKCINDTYGHQTGDMVLVTIANILKKSIRKTDVLGRWGGEEFLIICPHTNIKGAAQKAERMRKMIFDCCFDEVGKQTASFGVTRYQKGDTPHTIINRADKAMYGAKRQGRNAVMVD